MNPERTFVSSESERKATTIDLFSVVSAGWGGHASSDGRFQVCLPHDSGEAGEVTAEAAPVVRREGVVEGSATGVTGVCVYTVAFDELRPVVTLSNGHRA